MLYCWWWRVSDVSDLLTPTEFKLLLLLTLELLNRFQLLLFLLFCQQLLNSGFKCFQILLTALLNCVLWAQKAIVVICRCLFAVHRVDFCLSSPLTVPPLMLVWSLACQKPQSCRPSSTMVPPTCHSPGPPSLLSLLTSPSAPTQVRHTDRMLNFYWYVISVQSKSIYISQETQ